MQPSDNEVQVCRRGVSSSFTCVVCDVRSCQHSLLCVVASFACQSRALSTVALAYMIRRRQGRAAREAREAAMHLNLQVVVVGAGLLA